MPPVVADGAVRRADRAAACARGRQTAIAPPTIATKYATVTAAPSSSVPTRPPGPGLTDSTVATGTATANGDDRRERADGRGRRQREQRGHDQRLDGQRQQRQRLGADAPRTGHSRWPSRAASPMP